MIQVRRTIYHGHPGYLICGKRPGQQGGWPVSIFTTTETSARKIQQRVNAGEEIQPSDWTSE